MFSLGTWRIQNPTICIYIAGHLASPKSSLVALVDETVLRREVAVPLFFYIYIYVYIYLSK